jgi:hypothetical protein
MKKLLKRLIVVSLLPFMIIIGIASLFISIFTWILFDKEIINDVCDYMFSTTMKFLYKN